MKNPNLNQLYLLIENNKNHQLNRFVDNNDFLFLFLQHLKELYQQSGYTFKVLDPFFEPNFIEEQDSTISINDIEIGDICLLCNSFLEPSSLVYYSPSGFLEVNFMDFEEFETLSISDYIVLLHEVSAMLIGQFLLYKKAI